MTHCEGKKACLLLRWSVDAVLRLLGVFHDFLFGDPIVALSALQNKKKKNPTKMVLRQTRHKD